LRAVPALGLELREPRIRALSQLFQRAELDRLRRACLRARRLVPAFEAVVAERALPDPAVLLASEERGRRVGSGLEVPLVEDAERTCGDAVAAAVADVLLDDDRAELGAEERAGRADVEARGVRAVLADVGLHEPAEAGAAVAIAIPDQRLALL